MVFGFMKRWKTTLSQRKPQHFPKKRANALTFETVESWMEFSEKIYRQARLFRLTRAELSKRIWNCDEIAFCTALSSKLVIAKKRHQICTWNHGRERSRVHYSTLVCQCQRRSDTSLSDTSLSDTSIQFGNLVGQ